MNAARSLASLLMLAALNCAAATSAAAQTGSTTVYVAGNGIDDVNCGSKALPCRSITMGMEQAPDHGTVVVGPGRYGDLDGDGQLSSPGEEYGGIGAGCNCVVLIRRPMTVISSHGATVTVIDSSGMAEPLIAVLIDADNVRLGRREEGFLLKAPADYTGAYILSSINVTVAGNIATGGANGFFVDGGSNNVVQRNVAIGNTVGFEVRGSNQIIRLNHATENEVGFALYASNSRFSQNIASSNGDTGIVITETAATSVLTGNTVTGNMFTGIRANFGGAARITGNNIYGNLMCGIFNLSKTTIDARRNYWGAASGPGPNPADNVCNDEGVDITLTTPFATTSFPIPRLSGESSASQ
jgi:parallel beta-helix repeat protein